MRAGGLPQPQLLQLLDIEGDGSPPELQYDTEWLAVLRSTVHLHSNARGRVPLDAPAVAEASGGRASFTPTDAEQAEAARCADGGTLRVPTNFEVTAPPYVTGESIVAPQQPFLESPQTAAFCQKFGLPEGFRTQRGATLDAHGAPPATATPPRGGLPAPPSGGLFCPMPPMSQLLPAQQEEIDLGDD